MKNNLLSSLVAVLNATCILVNSQNPDTVSATQSRLILKADSLMSNYKFEQALETLAGGSNMSIDILSRIGQCQYRLGALTSAIKPFEQILQIDSTNNIALNQLGQLYAHNGDFNRSLPLYLRLVRLDSTNSYYYKQAGFMAASLNDKSQAKIFFERACKLNPADVEASLALGNFFFDADDYEAADKVVQRAIALAPTFRPILLLQAKIAYEQHQYEKTLSVLNTLIQSTDTTILFARMLCVSYFNLHDYDNVVNCVKFLLRNHFDSEWLYYYMGVAVRELGNVKGSVDWFKLAIDKSISENMKTYYSQLGKSYESMGDYANAIRAYKAAYNYSMEGIYLYHLARNYDIFYKDKSTALLYYEKYLKSEDTVRLAREYARLRMQDMGRF